NDDLLREESHRIGKNYQQSIRSQPVDGDPVGKGRRDLSFAPDTRYRHYREKDHRNEDCTDETENELQSRVGVRPEPEKFAQRRRKRRAARGRGSVGRVRGGALLEHDRAFPHLSTSPSTISMLASDAIRSGIYPPWAISGRVWRFEK